MEEDAHIHNRGRLGVRRAYLAQPADDRRRRRPLLDFYAMMRGRSKYLLPVILLVSLYLFYTFVLHTNDRGHLDVPDQRNPHSGSRPKIPKITVIAIWVPRSAETPIYIPYFFQSVEVNPQVDFLFVQVDKSNAGCKSYSKARNVQVSKLDL